MNKRLTISVVLLVIVAIFTGFWLYFSEEDSSIPPLETGVRISVTETAPPATNSPDIEDTGDVWYSLIENAENTVYISAYYLQSAGSQWRLSDIYDALENASERGIEVKILVDSSNFSSEMVWKLKDENNIEVRSWSGEGGGVLHSKYMIVDERVISLGSTNLSYYAMENWGGNREVNLLIRDGQVVKSYTYVFETGWTQAGGESWGAKYTWTDDWLVPVADGTENERIMTTIDAFRDLFNRAENDIYIYTYIYAGMPSEIQATMENAQSRGVSIHFLLDSISVTDYRPAVEELSDYQRVSVYVINHQHSAHAKFAVADGRWAYVGSSNIHPAWMYEGRQIGVLLKSDETAKTLLKIWEKDWLASRTHPFS